MYSKFGLKIYGVIYPPLDRRIFHPSTKRPSGDYVLTYFGKETKFSVIKRVADLGVKIKAFGSKTSFIDRRLLKNPNIEFLGRISTSDLVDAYSNALFTLFPFTHEPFGYIPLESMACGTPTLTYGMQGPGEYIIDGESGWLASDDEDIVNKAVEIWRGGYPSKIRERCVEMAKAFDRKIYTERWLELLKLFNAI
ncbi:MAG: glycosyltransferase [Candidatus Bathyarchaeia archaeon]